MKKNQPGCPCCDEICLIDRFTAEEEISSQTIRSSLHPQFPYPTWMQAEVSASSSSSISLLLVWGDSDGLYVEFTPQNGSTNGTLKLFRRGGDQIGSTRQLICADQELWHRITICVDTDTNEFTAWFDARDERGWIVRGQGVTGTIPSGFVPGDQFGYDGTGSIRRYRVDRLWYYGDLGTEEICCVPSIVETQKGQEGVAGSLASWEISFSTTGVFQIQVEDPDLPGNYFIQGFSYEGNASATLAEIVETINEYFTTSAFSSSGAILYCEGEMSENSVTEISGPVSVENLTTGGDEQEAANEIQTIAPPSARCAYCLIFGGQQTSLITEEMTAAEIQEELEALSSIGSGNVSVSGDPGGPFIVEFIGSLAETDVSLLSALEEDECLPCGSYAGDYGDCPKTYCRSCLAPSCDVVDERFENIDETGGYGPMPCGWDSAGTDWEVIDGEATGNGSISHEFDSTGGSYIVQATFSLGHLETIGDSVSASLTHGSGTHSITVTRLAGDDPESPDQYLIEWNHAGFSSYYSETFPAEITLRVCPYLICSNLVQTIVESVVTPGEISVSITQPTLSGHEDASLLSFNIQRSKEMDDSCDECQCTTECADHCVDSLWPSSWLVELSGFENWCGGAAGMNGGYYASRYSSSCHSYGFGDDGQGACGEDLYTGGDPLVPFSGAVPNNPLWEGIVVSGPLGVRHAGWLLKSGCDLDWSAYGQSIADGTYTFYDLIPAGHKETVGEDDLYYVVRVDVQLIPNTVGTELNNEFSSWDLIQPSPSSSVPGDPDRATHAIMVTVTRLSVLAIQNGGLFSLTWEIGIHSTSLVFGRKYRGVSDCVNLTDEEMYFLYGYDSGSRYIQDPNFDCGALSSPQWAFFGGKGEHPLFSTGFHYFDSEASLKITAL